MLVIRAMKKIRARFLKNGVGVGLAVLPRVIEIVPDLEAFEQSLEGVEGSEPWKYLGEEGPR